jgi:hypothetical protein
MAFALNNPLAWVQFQLRGGRRNLIFTMLAYVGIIGGLIFVSLKADPNSTTRILNFWTKALLALQLAILVLFAPTAIRNSIRRDLTTRMLESHRLMPTSATQAVLGLMIGSTVQFTLMLGLTYLVGSLTWLGAGGSQKDWLLVNVICGIFGLCFWFASTLLAFMPASGIGLMSIGVIASLMSGGAVMTLLPALGVLASPVMGRTVFGLLDRGAEWSWPYQAAALVQICMAGLCYLAAVRKYRREDLLAFTPALGLILVAGWGMLSCTVVRYPEAFSSNVWGRGIPYQPGLASVGSMISAVLLALVPVSSAAWQTAEWERRRRLQDPFLPRRPVPVNLTVLAAVLILGMVADGLPVHEYLRLDFSAIVAMSISAGCLLLACGYLLRILYRVTTRTITPLLLLVLFVGIGPLLLDLGRFALGNDLDADVVTTLSACSPLGLAWCLWNGREIWLWPAVVVQMLPPLILGLLYHRSTRRLTARPAAATGATV